MSTFSKIPFFIRLSLIALFTFLLDVILPWLEVLNGPLDTFKLFILTKAFQSYSPSDTFSK